MKSFTRQLTAKTRVIGYVIGAFVIFFGACFWSVGALPSYESKFLSAILGTIIMIAGGVILYVTHRSAFKKSIKPV